MLSSDKEKHVQSLIAEAIRSVCIKELSGEVHQHLTLDGLLGITLDASHIFLVKLGDSMLLDVIVKSKDRQDCQALNKVSMSLKRDFLVPLHLI